jgi:hypothetical protein
MVTAVVHCFTFGHIGNPRSGARQQFSLLSQFRPLACDLIKIILASTGPVQFAVLGTAAGQPLPGGAVHSVGQKEVDRGALIKHCINVEVSCK